ncbi:hypothetical protein DPMN_132857 [Dreissena polymorpha]|uniref:Uncharacterized protein n=1 Tax=Dreissena polymorpha TaxID=45954 RepID=A0A9D4FXG5_DREPO|nr:hypothetical protein DPMN_132857 [Dreissena polymorpha]
MHPQKKSLYLLLNVPVVMCARFARDPLQGTVTRKSFKKELAPETTLSEIIKTNAKVMHVLTHLEDEKAKVEF